jgi:hypothetical protein
MINVLRTTLIRNTLRPLSSVAALACLFLGVYIQDAAATSPPLPIVIDVRVTVTPEVALPGVARTLTISGMWHSGCTPVSPRLAYDAEAAQTKVAIVTLRSIDPVCLSLAGPSPFSHQLPFTPRQLGTTGVLVLEEVSGSVIAKGEVVTQQAGKARSLLDLDGFWFSVATSGSALALTHAHSGNDGLMGAWFLHSNGVPRWYSIQRGSWQSPTVFIGRLMEFSAPPQGCNPAVPGCPLAATSGRDFGWVRLTVSNDSTLVAEAHADPAVPVSVPLPDEATLLFRVTLNRFKL